MSPALVVRLDQNGVSGCDCPYFYCIIRRSIRAKTFSGFPLRVSACDTVGTVLVDVDDMEHHEQSGQEQTSDSEYVGFTSHGTHDRFPL